MQSCNRHQCQWKSLLIFLRVSKQYYNLSIIFNIGDYTTAYQFPRQNKQSVIHKNGFGKLIATECTTHCTAMPMEQRRLIAIIQDLISLQCQGSNQSNTTHFILLSNIEVHTKYIIDTHQIHASMARP